MKLAIDMDDCLLDLTGGVRGVVEREFGVELPPFDRWDLNAYLRPVLGESWLKFMRRRDWLWATFPAIPGAIGTLGLLRRDGHYLEILTSKPEWAEASVFDWLAKWRPPVHRVTIVGPDDVKAEHSDADILVDDRLLNVVQWSETGRQAILFTRSHNVAHHALPAGVTRADTWRDVRDVIERLASTDVVDS